MTMRGDDSVRSVPNLLSEVLGQITSLFRKEMQLARAEVSEKLDTAVGAIGAIVAGAVLIIAALGALVQAAVLGLIMAGIAPHWAALVVGVVLAIIGIIVVKMGMSQLSAAKLAPKRTVAQVNRDATLARDQVR
ncbi:protein-S-isoprenylcysteine O-methyltransferase Ste14 [Rhodoligotrophos appendicifer]|uniref:phage holin family protein n=1 Tax=Rhodoligotrophos appendicifer TaxID=987056 RepID=UPI001185E743|nr:phage holin family protein [Rhodoligotrophos appendicifer]